MEYRNKAVFRRIKRQQSFWDLASKRRAGMAPGMGDDADRKSKPRDSVALQDSPPTQHAGQRKNRLHKASLHFRQSISDLEIPNKLQQVIRRTRSLEEQHEHGEPTVRKATAFGPRLRKSMSNLASAIRLNGADERSCRAAGVSSRQRTSAAAPAFWEAYRERLRHQNEMEIANEAMRIAHTYDDDNGLQMPRLPQVHEKTLTVLEGRTPLSPVLTGATNFSWSGDGLANMPEFLELPPPALCFLATDFCQTSSSPLSSDAEDFDWAGDQWMDFRRFVVAAESGEWVMV